MNLLCRGDYGLAGLLIYATLLDRHGGMLANYKLS